MIVTLACAFSMDMEVALRPASRPSHWLMPTLGTVRPTSVLLDPIGAVGTIFGAQVAVLTVLTVLTFCGRF